MKTMLRAGLMAAALTCAAPLLAQTYPADPGDFTDVSMIKVLPGGDTAYTQFLATEWKKQQEFAKSQGWIKSYKVMSNLYPREGEPDLYLMVTYADMPNAQAAMKQRDAYLAWQKKSLQTLDQESGDRGKFRTLVGSMLWGEVILK
ncbi:hypothetical protein SAMIE_1022300 [Sphingobium amiense]|uniref:DUF1330 domain-containing protein n=1 Tax=Sphingobium amiense TaxID=135719 RepID=A0A494WE60_9SPHN|nr:hypothetical protein [Sphingobium amiense]BBD98729.1 hypothetical protein SAMIE_1022300 [Sphingobium amiense]